MTRSGWLERYGDVTVLTLGGSAPAPGTSTRIAVACDSIGAIGPKRADRVRVPGYVVGRFALRVPLMELWALGAEPRLAVCTLCVEPDPTGGEIMDGARDEARAAGLDPDAFFTGSSEKNVPTVQTGVGVTVLGTLGAPRWGLGREGDEVLAVGCPRVGTAVSLEDATLADVPTLRRALEHPACGDALPVGSRGVAAEARDLAARSGCGFAPAPEPGLDLEASAGPGTCFLVTVPARARASLERHLAPTGRPCAVVGRLTGGGAR